MKLKMIEIDGKTYAETQDGKPVYEDEGKDIAFDAPGTVGTIKRLNGEAKSHREAKEAAEAALKKFEGIEDPEAAQEAVRKLAALDSKELLQADKVEEIKQAAVKAVEEKMRAAVDAKDREIAKITGDRDKISSHLDNELIGGNFSRSGWIKDNIAVPVDMFESRFKDRFKVEDGKVVAKDEHGQNIYSQANPGELAGFDEAIQQIVKKYPHADDLLKGRGNSGGDAPGGGGHGGGMTMSRDQFNQLGAAERAQKMKQPGFKIT